ncbi:hypothetical protein HYFRA_00000967 [Hymenoscyphus fraxineus]|uniref:Uncharacterized protein n=1 Tax=Hymenoscyphus fraxineus TaxID=746836 RepID=A0A9N9KVE3_9HELO|nr:hypothetical protein HYFRA_00000967 [Hymenoscyphus fraxineus]
MFRTSTPFFSALSPPNHPPPPIQHPISMQTKISFPSFNRKQPNPRIPHRKTSLAKINIHSIAQAFSNLTDNILSPKEFEDMIEDALCSPITEEVSRGREDDDEKTALLGEHKRKRGSSILRPDPKQGRRTKEGKHDEDENTNCYTEGFGV